MIIKNESFTFAVPPSIRGGEQEVTVVENSQAQLVCVAEGVPQPSLSWEKDGNPISESTGEYTILPSGELAIGIAQVNKETHGVDLVLYCLFRLHIVQNCVTRYACYVIYAKLVLKKTHSLLISPAPAE